MAIRFTKMHGLGNDFMVLDGISQKIDFNPKQIAALSRRDTGVGFDQCLVVEASPDNTVDFFYRIYNANGQEVGQCGNGARCLARFLQHKQLTNKRLITVATQTTRMQLQLNEDETVTVNMGRPKFDPADIPLLSNTKKILYTLPLASEEHDAFHAVNVGNPHAVLLVPKHDTTQIQQLGKLISEHSYFPEQTNVGFMKIINENHIRLRVYERGCGETRACGSGAVAAVAVGRLYHHLAAEVRVTLPGGDLLIHWPSLDGDIFLTGPATFVYEGSLM